MSCPKHTPEEALFLGIIPPSEAAAARAQPIFTTWLHNNMPVATPVSKAPDLACNQRAYPIAASMLPTVQHHATSSSVTHVSTLDMPFLPRPNSASVRPSVVSQLADSSAKTSIPPMLIDHVSTAMVRGGPSGEISFDLVFQDDVFTNLTCTITIAQNKTSAVFGVTDHNNRRLLEAELGRLRVALESRGLRVDHLDVQMVL